MTNGTLVLIDIQDKFLTHLNKSAFETFSSNVLLRIEQAKSNDNGIIICNYEPSFYGEPCDFVVKALDGYSKTLSFTHVTKSVGAEVLSIIRQQHWSLECVLLCGLYLKYTIKDTMKEIGYCSNYQIKVECDESACIDR